VFQRRPPLIFSVLQAAQHTRSFYHRRVQRRTSAGCARYSTASGFNLLSDFEKKTENRKKSAVEPWNAFDLSGASSRVLLRDEALF